MSTTAKKAASKKAAKKAGQKSAAKKATKKAASKKGATKATGAAAPLAVPLADDRVRIRMYNVGFGDGFLLIVPNKDGRPRKVLVDCGVHMSGTNKLLKLKDLVKRIVADVTEPDGVPRIDVVIATHRHRDHVHGFREALWQSVEVGEVWMPWTEHPTDPRAREIRDVQGKIAEQLDKALKKKTDAPLRFGLKGAKLAETKELRNFISNSLPNAEAMKTLHDGFAVFPGRKKVERRFLPPAKREEHSFECDLLPGVHVHVMGPSRDEAVIRDMDPPKGKSYLRMAESLPDGDEKLLPFREEWVIEDAQGHNAQYGFLTEKELAAVKNAGEGTEFGVAVKLEDAVNGTSLMLMFEIGKSFLLFPGDAQWGTWEAARKDPEWLRLLEKTNFYKVGHHGSHNATPKEFVEEIVPENFWGMVSSSPVKKFKHIPRIPLLEAMRDKKHGKIVRMDKREATDSADFRRVGDKKVGDVYVEVDIPI